MHTEQKEYQLDQLQPDAEGVLDISKHATMEDKHVRAMEWGNRVAHLPTDKPMSQEEQLAACGLLPDEKNHTRIPRVPRMWKLGKVIQVVGGAPEAMNFIRPKGVDEVWAINPRDYWPVEQAPDLIVSRDHSYLQGPTDAEPTFTRWGVTVLTQWPQVPVMVSSDLGWWVAERILHGTHYCPPWLRGRPWFELSLHNIFDTQFGPLAGFSVGLALAAAFHSGAKIVLTGMGGLRSDAMYKLVGSRGYKSEQSVRNEDRHIDEQLALFCNKYGGKRVWTHGPNKATQSVAPDWPE